MLQRGWLLLGVTALIVLSTATGPAAAQLPGEEDPFPGPDELHDRLDEFAEHPWVSIEQVGESNEGHPIRVLEVVDPNGSVPIEQRPVTLLLTQQHGDEPAGTPAALRVLANITQGEQAAGWLSNQVLLVLPMVNPDGAEAGTRGNADGVDINRDHIALETPEARAVHRVLNQWDVDVANDHHEYGGTGAGNPVPVRVYDHDLLVLFPKHGNVRAPTVQAAQELMYEGIWPETEQAGYSVNEYGEVTANDRPVDTIAGGPDPGILRNHFGLHNVAGLLIESRIDAHPNPFHTPERRIQINRVVMDATLSYVHQHPERFVDAKKATRELATSFPETTYEEGESEAPLERAYELPNRTDLVETMQRHDLDPGLPADDGFVHDTWHPLQGHAAAIFHPASSRTVANGTPTELPVDDAPLETAAADGNDTPLPAWSVLVALAGALLAGQRRRRAG